MNLKFELFVILKSTKQIISYGLYDSYEDAISKISTLIESGIVKRVSGPIKARYIEDRGWQIRKVWIDE